MFTQNFFTKISDFKKNTKFDSILVNKSNKAWKLKRKIDGFSGRIFFLKIDIFMISRGQILRALLEFAIHHTFQPKITCYDKRKNVTKEKLHLLSKNTNSQILSVFALFYASIYTIKFKHDDSQEQQTVMRETMCVRMIGGRFDFPRYASFAAVKMISWWEAEFTLAFRSPSGLSPVNKDDIETIEEDDGAVKKTKPSEFILLVVETSEMLMSELNIFLGSYES